MKGKTVGRGKEKSGVYSKCTWECVAGKATRRKRKDLLTVFKWK